jgi:PIN domain nuclease of toxin-antitoxin system
MTYISKTVISLCLTFASCLIFSFSVVASDKMVEELIERISVSKVNLSEVQQQITKEKTFIAKTMNAQQKEIKKFKTKSSCLATHCR